MSACVAARNLSRSTRAICLASASVCFKTAIFWSPSYLRAIGNIAHGHRVIASVGLRHCAAACKDLTLGC